MQQTPRRGTVHAEADRPSAPTATACSACSTPFVPCLQQVADAHLLGSRRRKRSGSPATYERQSSLPAGYVMM